MAIFAHPRRWLFPPSGVKESLPFAQGAFVRKSRISRFFATVLHSHWVASLSVHETIMDTYEKFAIPNTTDFDRATDTILDE